MKLLYVSDASSIHTLRWAECMRDRGNEVHIASFLPGNTEGIKVHILPQWGFAKIGYLQALSALRQLFHELQPDVVHAHFVTSYGFLAALAQLKPLALTACGTDVLISPWRSSIHNYCARYAIKNAHALTSVAEHMNPAMYALGAKLGSVKAITFGVDCSFFVPDQDYLIGTPIRIISTRHFRKIYDLKTLIAALSLLDRAGVDFRCQLIGDGPLRNALNAQVVSLGLGSKIKFLGQVPPQALRDHLAKSDVFVSSAHSDGNNVSLNEAMACGCFPIATDIPANRRWIGHGNNGLLYPIGDKVALFQALLKSMTPITEWDNIRTNNINLIKQQADWQIAMKQMESVYDQLAFKTTS